MKRSQVPLELTWDLTCLYENDQKWEDAYNAVLTEHEKIQNFKGKLNDAGSLLKCFEQIDEIDRQIEHIYTYAHLKHDIDQSVSGYKAMYDKAHSLIVKIRIAFSFFAPELSALDEGYINDCIKNPQFENYNYQLSEILRQKKYILSQKEERILAMSGAPLAAFEDTFSIINNVELPFPKVDDGSGNKVKLSHGIYSVLLSNQNPKIRAGAFNAMYKTFSSLTNTFASVLSGYVKANVFKSQARGFDSPLAASLHGNHVPVGVYDNLIRSVNANFKPMHDYVALRKKALKLKTLHMYDMYVPIVSNAEIKLEYKDAYDLVVKALAPMGEDYIAVIKKAYEKRWIDALESEGKRSGAYVSGGSSPHPFILFNYQQTTHDVFTIAHELGHALHSYCSAKTQPYSKKNYEIFVAEVASTVNEVLLLKYLLNKQDCADTKKYLLSYYLDMFRTTLFRQTMFAEFEKEIHQTEMNNQPLTSEALCQKYLGLNKKYYGKAVKHDDYIKYEWSRIPHFYYNFYVYQYATGLTAAVNIAYKILNEGEAYRDKYIKDFLSAGGHKSPYEILKDAGVDLMQSRPFEIAMKEFTDTLEQLETLFK